MERGSREPMWRARRMTMKYYDCGERYDVAGPKW